MFVHHLAWHIHCSAYLQSHWSVTVVQVREYNCQSEGNILVKPHLGGEWGGQGLKAKCFEGGRAGTYLQGNVKGYM